MKIYIAIILFAFLLILTGCTKTFNDVDKYNEFVKGENSPFRKTIERDGVRLVLTYLPAESVMTNELKDYQEKIKSNKNPDEIRKQKEELEKSKQVYDNSIYFLLNLSYTDSGRDIVYEKLKLGRNVYSEWLEKLLFDLKKSIQLKSSEGMEIPLSLYHFDRTFEMQRDRNFLLSFSKKFNEKTLDLEKTDWIRVKIKEFGLRIGSVNFKFDLPFEEINLKLN